MMLRHAHLTTAERAFLRPFIYAHRQFINVQDTSPKALTIDDRYRAFINNTFSGVVKTTRFLRKWSRCATKIDIVTKNYLDEPGKGTFEEPQAKNEGHVLAVPVLFQGNGETHSKVIRSFSN